MIRTHCLRRRATVTRDVTDSAVSRNRPVDQPQRLLGLGVSRRPRGAGPAENLGENLGWFRAGTRTGSVSARWLAVEARAAVKLSARLSIPTGGCSADLSAFGEDLEFVFTGGRGELFGLDEGGLLDSLLGGVGFVADPGLSGDAVDGEQPEVA